MLVAEQRARDFADLCVDAGVNQAERRPHEAAARFEAEPSEPDLDSTVRAQLHDVGRQLPILWASGRLNPAHKKTLLRTLIRRVILARPQPDRIEIKVVWVSGAFSVLEAHPPIHRTVDLSDYEPEPPPQRRPVDVFVSYTRRLFAGFDATQHFIGTHPEAAQGPE